MGIVIKVTMHVEWSGGVKRPLPGACQHISQQFLTCQAVRAICDRYEVLFIADEVVTSFGRTGRWFGMEHFDVLPDTRRFAFCVKNNCWRTAVPAVKSCSAAVNA